MSDGYYLLPYDCDLCLFRHMQLSTQHPEDEGSVYFWREFFQDKGVDFARQQDAIEALRIMRHEPVMETLLKKVGLVSSKVHYEVTYPCGHCL